MFKQGESKTDTVYEEYGNWHLLKLESGSVILYHGLGEDSNHNPGHNQGRICLPPEFRCYNCNKTPPKGVILRYRIIKSGVDAI